MLSQCLNLHLFINSKGAPTNLNSCPWPTAAQQGLKVLLLAEESLGQDDNLLLGRLFAWVPALSVGGGSHLRLVLPAWLGAQGGWGVTQLNPQQWLLLPIITRSHSNHWAGHTEALARGRLQQQHTVGTDLGTWLGHGWARGHAGVLCSASR